MNAFIHLIHAPVVARLGWVLIHFLWEGAAIGLALAVLLRIFHKASSHFRYLVICAALFGCGVAPVITWAVLVHQGASVLLPQEPATDFKANPAISKEPSVAGVLKTKSQPAPVSAATRDRTASSWEDDNLRILERLLPFAVAFWFAGVLMLTLRLALGWMQLRSVRGSGAAVSDPEWLDRFRHLAKRMRVSAPVQLLTSALVEVPTVIGWLRPVILLPASVFTGLTTKQLESILAHELAHVRRYDYLVNLLQTALETILFYHPAVWWISRRLREERENCCDDIAVETMSDRAVYASALAVLEQGRAFPSRLALAASDGPLLRRIRRIAGVDPAKSSLAPLVATVLAVGMLLMPQGGQATSDTPKESDAGSKTPRSLYNLCVTVEIYAMAGPDSTQLLARRLSGAARHEQVLELVKNGKARLVTLLSCMTKNGFRAKLEQNDVMYYPTDFTKPTAAGDPSFADAYEARNVGESLECEPAKLADGRLCNVNYVLWSNHLDGFIDTRIIE